MSADEKLDFLARSVSDGRPVDWIQEETEANVDEESGVRALRDVSAIAEFSRDLQRGITEDETTSSEEDVPSEAPDDNK